MNYLESKKMFMNCCDAYCAPATIEYYHVNFTIFEKWLAECGKTDIQHDISVITKIDLIDYISWLRSTGVKNTSVRTYARAVRSFFKTLYRFEIIQTDITVGLKLPKTDKKQILPLTSADVKILETSICRNNLNYVRDLAIFYLMLNCGLRLSEVVNLNRSDVDFEKHCLRVNCSKNGKSRLLVLSSDDEIRLKTYWCSLRYIYNDCQPECAFTLFGSSSRITDNAIKCMFGKLKKRTNIPIHAHLCRHTYATSYIFYGGNMEYLRILLGHDSYDVTREYLHISAEMQICNIDIYRIPYIAR